MKRLKGIPVSAGVAIGYAKIIEREKLHIDRKSIPKNMIEAELKRFKDDVDFVVKEIEHLISNYSYSKENEEILTAQKMILRDPEFSKRVTALISEELDNLENAISTYFTEITDIFNNMDNEFFSQRLSDFEDVAYRLLSHTLKKRKNLLNKLDETSILIMENISPSFVTKVFEKKIQGLCTEKGSKNSHSSIIARSMNLPTLVSTIELLENIEENQQVIIDGNKGELIISPTKSILEKYEKIFQQENAEKEKLQKLVNIESKTIDNRKIKLMSNIEIPEEIDQVLKYKSEGIGLFRTEFLFIDIDELPSEEEQYKIYRKIAEKCYPEPVIIRTIDVGGDKFSKILNITHEENPNLGWRGIRISLENIPIFRQQVRAILRANIKGNVKIMFPMISCVEEIIEAKKIIEECKKDLKKEKVRYVEDIEIGAMIEIPSAVITSDTLAEECDFLSIGTNDLVQYILAVDRDNESISKYYKPCDPSVIRSIKLTVDNAHEKGIKVAICGEMASEKIFVKLLVGLGIDELSVSPGRLLIVKNEILKCDKKNAEKLVAKILRKNTSDEIYQLLIK
ncbi:MAG: phosphoenolpyruvate--protein phosphotransferase [Candidatus Cloacimonetes bacterium]|nr:phosphoenolpyruvate--protein phosphotransferase [Candidatus Cloacimonadota bacterium]